ncbi:MAG: sulfatase, partial [Lentisphaerae bacterium]
MRILYIDIDSLRPDHLGCYGYHRNTSPNIDAIAAEGICLDRCYASDVPCLPSRSALFSGRFGYSTGVVNHCGSRSEPYNEANQRLFTSPRSETSWPALLSRAGYHTATISSFAERHSAWHWYAGFREIIDPGYRGMEQAEDLWPHIQEWLQRRGCDDNWFLHVNFWDPHTPYRTPLEYPNIFAGQPIPDWLSEDIRRRHWAGFGPQSAQDRDSFDGSTAYSDPWPRQPGPIDSMEKVRMMFDGYDLGVHHADMIIGRILELLHQLKIADETAIIVSADHGEALGEMNIYGCHQLADHITANVPLIIRWPGLIPPSRYGNHVHFLCYQFDLAATVLDILQIPQPSAWHARSFRNLIPDDHNGVFRPCLVISQLTATCQRAVRWDRYLAIRNYHDGFRDLPP